MKTLSQLTFLEWLLIFLLINLVILFWYQRNGCLASCFGGNCDAPKKESFGDPGQVMIPEMQNKHRLLDNMDRGVKVGFHQHFRPYLPELGWRRLYEKMNNTVTHVGNLHDPLIKGVKTRNYLDVMSSLDNVYKYTNY